MAESGVLTPVAEWFDLCVAWNWEHDGPFVFLLERACAREGMRMLSVRPESLEAVLARLASGEVGFRVLLDRASDVDGRFFPLVSWAKEHGRYQLNPHDRAVASRNKASMHLEFITAGLHTPYTIILPPFDEHPGLPPLDLAPLGQRFCVKPAHGGGGEGVIRSATTVADIERARQTFPSDPYLVQAWVVPEQLDGRPAWFRILYCGGAVFPCWWDPLTHQYDPLAPDDEARLGLGGLRDVARVIAWVCGLDLFSTEVARVPGGSLVVVDYVNDPVDLRLRSCAPDGVPDEIIEEIASRLARSVAEVVRVPEEGRVDESRTL